MLTIGEIAERVFKVMDEYSKNGVCIARTDACLADMNNRLGCAMDMAYRRLKVMTGLDKSKLDIHAQGGVMNEYPLPDGYVDTVAVVKSNGDDPDGKVKCFDADGKLYVTAKTGDYTVIYTHYPENLENKSESDTLDTDEYLTDILVYETAAELCEKEDPEMFARLRYRSDLLMANRYNVDKLKAPRFNRVYGVIRKRGI